MSDPITVTEQPIQVTVVAGDPIQITPQPDIVVTVSEDGSVTVLEQPITVTVETGDVLTVTETPVDVIVGGADHPSTHAIDSANHTGVISAAQHPVIASGNHHSEYGRKASAEAISGAWTFSALLVASAHIQLGALGEIRDSAGVRRIKLAATGIEVELGGASGAGGDVRLNDRVGIATTPQSFNTLTIGLQPGGGTVQMALGGTKVGAADAGISLVNFQTIYDLAGAANAFFEGFNVVLSVTDPSTGGSIGDIAAFKVAPNIQDGATVTRLALFRFPHPPSQNGNVGNFSVFDVGDVDEGLSSAGGSVLRIGDRGGADPSPWGATSMGLGGYARPISQEWTSAAMVGIAGGGSFYSVHAADITFGRNGAPAVGLLADFDSTVGGLGLPRMTTAQRDALAGPPPDGTLIYNTTIPSMQKRQGGAWVNF